MKRGPRRVGLGRRLDETLRIKAYVQKFGNTKDTNARTACLRFLRDPETSELIADHAWIKTFVKGPRFKPGDTVILEARVIEYKHRKKHSYNSPKEYGLTDVEILEVFEGKKVKT